MKHSLLSAAALAALCCSASMVYAQPTGEDHPPMEGAMGHEGHGARGGMGGMHDGKRMEPPANRQEAIKRSKEFTAKLEKMSDEEWNKKHEERQARREKWKEATPEEREKMKDKMKEMREKRKGEESK